MLKDGLGAGDDGVLAGPAGYVGAHSAPAGNSGAAEAAGGRKGAAGLMFAGAALVAGEIAAQIALMNTVSYSGNGGNFLPEAALIFVGIPVTAVECALWVWTGSMALAGRGWARIVSSVFFGGMCMLLIDYIHGFPSGLATRP